MGVVELTSPGGVGGAIVLALACVRAAQQQEKRGWCAWVDPDKTLYAPGVLQAGIDCERLLVVRPPRNRVWSISEQVVRSQAFSVVVVDADPLSGVSVSFSKEDPLMGVRRLARLTEKIPSTVLVLTNSLVRRKSPLPTLLRLHVERPHPAALSLEVTKDRWGRQSLRKVVPRSSYPQGAALAS